ncbi:MAG: hypothetical protein ACT4OO_08645 [Nitrospiraceae bacterium]
MSETTSAPAGSMPCDHHRSEELMLREDTVQEMLARLARGERVKTIARDLSHIIHDGSWRNRQDARRDGRAEPRETEAYLIQYVREEARLGAPGVGRLRLRSRGASPPAWVREPAPKLVAAAYRRLQ